jgi:preprotein translocase subunit SecD
VVDADRVAVDQSLKEKGVTPTGAFLDQGRLTLRFASTQDQLKARDVINEAHPNQFTIALSKASRVPEWMRNLGLSPMKLGLDLRGGVYLVYQVDVQGAVKQLLDRHEQDFRASLRNARVPYQDVAVDYPSYRVRVTFRDADSLVKGKAAILADNRNLNFTETTVDGAPALELKLTPQEIKERQDYAVQQNIVILRNRLNSPELAVSEPQVAREGVDRISIQLPGLQNSAEVKKILGKTATLEFRMVDEGSNPLEAASTGRVPLGSKLYYTRDKQPVLLKREVVVTGDQLTDASFQPNTQEGAAVSVSLDSRGAAKMLKNTQENLGHLMAVVFIDRSRDKNAEGVVVDRTSEEVINRATIRGVFSNNFQITGVNPIEGRELALLLRAGGLAAPVTPIQERAIGPSLGQDNIDKGVHAMVFGMLAAFIFMAVYYKVFGLIADLTLVANVVLLTALLSLLGGVALTLPGIAAVVLTVGMAVDANILIYERIREELRNGVSPRAAIAAGFERAFSAIFDSNITAFIAGLVLWLFGAGAVRGFAVVLMLGIVTSMFTAVMGSHALVQVIYGGKRKIDHLSI